MRSPWASTMFRGKRALELDSHARGGLARMLLWALLPLSLALFAVFTIALYVQARAVVTRQASAQLTSVALLKESQVDQWAAAHIADVRDLARSPAVLPLAQAMVAKQDPAARQALADRLNSFLAVNSAYQGLLLARADTGEVVIATALLQHLTGQTVLDPAELELAQAQMDGLVIAPRYDPGLGGFKILAAASVMDARQRPVALVLGLVRYEPLVDLIGFNPGLGPSARAYLVTADGDVVSTSITPETAQPVSPGIERARLSHENGGAIYVDPNGQRVVGAFRWLPAYGLALLVERNTSEVYAPLNRFVAVAAVLALLAILITGLVVVQLARRLVAPVEAATGAIVRLAGGDLSATVRIARDDETGLLAQSFNQMGVGLHRLVQDLERKSLARTRQFAIAAEVGRAATSILRLEEMLARAVTLVRERFGYEHVSIFLLDDTGQFAVLQESTAGAGSSPLERGHRLAADDDSLVGWVIAHQQARVTLDPSAGPPPWRDEWLPGMHARAALPLRLGERIVGALELQSRDADIFAPADIEVLQIVADQIAVAVENGRLFTRQERTAQLEQRTTALMTRIHQSLTLDAILENAMMALGQAFGARKVVVRLNSEPSSAEAQSADATPTRAVIPAPEDAGTNGAAGNGSHLRDGPSSATRGAP